MNLSTTRQTHINFREGMWLRLNNLEIILKENFDTILILVLILFLLKEGVEDMETLLALICLLFN